MSTRVLVPLLDYKPFDGATTQVTWGGVTYADVFAHDILTISGAGGQEIAIYLPHQWLQATVERADGYPEYCLQNSRYVRWQADRLASIQAPERKAS